MNTKTTPPAKITPLMQQYFTIKNEYPDALLFFQVGDFYELFYDDAEIASSFLAITLTKRGKSEGTDIPLCGVPVHALHHYLIKLIKGGFKVAIADQMSKPIPGQVVERKVSRYITPGTIIDEYLIDQKKPSYLCVLYPETDTWGILFTEILSAQTFVTAINHDTERLLEAELSRFFPDEILVPQTTDPKMITFLKQKGYIVSIFTNQTLSLNDLTTWATTNLPQTIHTHFLDNPVLLKTVHMLQHYLLKNNLLNMQDELSIHVYETDDYLILDTATQKNLDIIPLDGHKREHTLLGILDHAITPMGSRMIKKWLLRPLIQQKQIEERNQFVFFLKEHITLLQKTRTTLQEISDLERIIGRISLGKAQKQDYCALTHSLLKTPILKEILLSCQEVPLAHSLLEKIDDFSLLSELLTSSINDDTQYPWLIKPSFDFELDRLRNIVKNSKEILLELEQEEAKKTGLSTLKITYTDLYGYAFEISKNQANSLPEYFTLQQSLSNKNRYITERLTQLQHDIKTANARVEEVEKEVFQRIAQEVLYYKTSLRHAAHALATLDSIASFAHVAYLQHYTRPSFNNENSIYIESGRHPVIEQTTTNFIPNDTYCDNNNRVHIVTGPNMGGKSTYLRQVGLIHIMAHVGSLVPASNANLSLLDRLFTRIGSGDDLAQGKSTFLVEMEETGIICTQATEKSLVILDEVGRGTSTYDGMALAHSIIEFLAKTIKTRALFATHYHELTRLEDTCPGVSNFFCAAQKNKNSIIFLHTIKKGTTHSSFGIEIARLARLPEKIITRAEEVLQLVSKPLLPTEAYFHKNPYDTYIPATKETKILETLRALHLDELSPRQALDILYELKQNALM